MADISALFQAMGVGGDQPQAPPQLDMGANPLAALGIGPQAPPDLGPQPVDPLAADEAKYQKAYDEAVAKWNAPPQSMLNQNIADFNKYADQRYQQKFGGSKLGVANAFLQAVLAGTKGKTLTEINDEAAKKDWDEAMKLEAQRIAQEKNTAATQAAFLKQQLDNIKSQRLAQQAAQRDETANRRIDVNSPENKAAVTDETRKARIQDMKDSGLWDSLSEQDRKYVEINGKLPPPTKESSSAFVITRDKLEGELKRKLTSDELLRLNTWIRANPYDIQREQVVIDREGNFVKVPVETKRTTPPPVVQGQPSQASPGVSSPTGGGVSAKPTGVQARVNIPATTGEFFGGLNTSLGMAKDIYAKLSDPKIMEQVNTGPVMGRVTLAQWEKLGGVGLTKTQNGLANDLRRLITTEAFANGGKQLTITEKAEFEKLLPQMSDTLPKAVIQAKKAIEYLQRKKEERIKSLPQDQRSSLEQSGAINGAPKAKVWDPVTGTFK